MQFSESWLRSFVDPALDSAELAHALTMAGLEVEELADVAPPFSGVVVAQVLTCEKHPNADKLKLCRVDAGGGEPLQIVCGAPNVEAGIKVPCALPGARLPGMDIAAAKVRGVESFGMLCSARELGLAQDQAGLLVLPADAPLGAALRQYLGLDDKRFTLKLTPNRSDCLGVRGVAREVAALTGAALVPLEGAAAPVAIGDRLSVNISAPDLCGRFSGRVIRGVNAAAPTPAWMRQRLERSGQRPISALVDISNYVMLELNRPNHVFALDKIAGGLEVRWARRGESLLLLNGQTIELAEDVGVIAGADGVESLAGIMGGEATAVSTETRDIYVEAAFWWPDAIQGRARRYGFSSDAAFRFERGVDYADTVEGVERVTRLILEICGGQAGPVDDQVLRLPERKPIRLRPARAGRVLGVALAPAQIDLLLRALGLALERDGEDFVVTPPSYRFDLVAEEDLIEELARLHGYDNIPAATPVGALAMLPQSERVRDALELKRLLAARDYQEVINFSFVDAALEADFSAPAWPIALANPIASQMGVMRSSLIGGLITNLAVNLKRRIERVRVFEVGRCFLRSEHDGTDDVIPGYRQPLRLAALAAGAATAEQWGMATRKVDYFDVKTDVEALLAPAIARFERTAHPALHPGRAAAIVVGGAVIGAIGEVHPRWVQKYELGTSPVVFEVDLAALLTRGLPDFQAPSRFPAVVRDLAFLVAPELPIQALLDALLERAPAIVRSISVFDLYHGERVERGQKSVALRVVMQDTEKTLADAEADAAIAFLVELAAEKFAAKLRS